MTFIHQLAGWPQLTWDSESLTTSLATVRHKQGKHLGRIQSMGFELQTEAHLSMLTEEAVKSSAIEEESLNAKEVRSSIARKLGIDAGGLPEPGRQVEGVVEMMLDATRNFQEPLSTERLCSWHAALFPTGRSGMYRIIVGDYRDDAQGPMQVVSGPLGNEQVHFQAPPAENLPSEMKLFLEWFNSSPAIDPVLFAGVAHFWFVTIHPFDDGNGRLARAIGEMALARADGTHSRFYSMSSSIEARRNSYYKQLATSQSSSLDITAWLAWFIDCLESAVDDAERSMDSVLQKARFWQRLTLLSINERQRRVLNRLLDDFQGHLTTSKYAKLAKCSTDTALRDIKVLLQHGIIRQNTGGGRSTSYRLILSDGQIGKE